MPIKTKYPSPNDLKINNLMKGAYLKGFRAGMEAFSSGENSVTDNYTNPALSKCFMEGVKDSYLIATHNKNKMPLRRAIAAGAIKETEDGHISNKNSG